MSYASLSNAIEIQIKQLDQPFGNNIELSVILNKDSIPQSGQIVKERKYIYVQ